MKPVEYIGFLRNHSIKVIIRLNQKNYDAAVFEKEGIRVIDISYNALGNPLEEDIFNFIELCKDEIPKGNAVAVHCADGRG